MPLFGRNIEQQLFNAKLKKGKPMTELDFFARELTAWEHSSARREMLDGERYYTGDHDILKHTRMIIGPDGKMLESPLLPNNRIVDNQYAKHADQKKNYLLGKPVTFESPKNEYVEKVSGILGKKFMRTLKNAGLDSLNTGISWLYPYYNDNNELAFKYYSGAEILPFWRDVAHTELDCACRLYIVEAYVGTEKKLIKKVNIFKPEGMLTYVFENGLLKPDPDSPSVANYVTVEKANGKTESYNWQRVPLIPIKYNAQEIPLIRRARALQDSINLIRSNFVNNMQEDVHSTILVLKNYDGTDLGEFRQNLATYGAIKVRTVEGSQGGVDTLQIEVNSENYKAVLEMLKTALIENMRSFDGKDDRLTGNPNQMNIQSLYADIDLDANDMETELQAAFEDVFWFINQHLSNMGEGDYDNTAIEVIFNRDMLINESEAIENCSKSGGIISDETIVAQHPWTKDPAKELEKLKEQATEAPDPYRNAFETGGDKGDGKE